MTPMRDHRTEIKSWLAKKNGELTADQIGDDDGLFERGILSSLRLLEFMLFLESLTGETIEVASLEMGSFRSVNQIHRNFFERVS